MRSEFDALLRSPMGRRALLKYMGVGAAAVGGSGILAACRKEATPAGGATSAAPSERPTIEEEPGVLKVYTWSRTS